MWIRIPAAAVLVAFAVAVPAHAQIGSMGAGSSAQMFQASQQETPEHRAVEAYNRAARNIKKAEGAKDPGQHRKFYEKAKDDLDTSLSLKTTFDSLLALGQVDLALGDVSSALTLGTQAESLKAGDAAARSCKEQAARQESGPARSAAAPASAPLVASPAPLPLAPPATPPPAPSAAQPAPPNSVSPTGR
jgi:hypothetical protein